MIKVHIFHTGRVRVDQAIPHREKNPLAVIGFLRGEKKKITLPVSCNLNEHPKGKVLTDTGWDSKYVFERPNVFLNSISKPIIKSRESVDCKLKKVGIAPTDIDYIFFSHMDFDHTSGLRLVQDAKHIMAAREEIADSRKYFFRYVKSTWKFTRIEPFDYVQTGIGPVEKSYDVFGDGSILLINTPGHSHGLFSAKITGDGGSYVVLAGDTAYTQKSFRERIIPGFTVDTKLAKKSLAWVCDCAADPHCRLVATNHDPSVKEQVIEL
mgnify:FL=1